jgi:hypothetical protein
MTALCQEALVGHLSIIVVTPIGGRCIERATPHRVQDLGLTAEVLPVPQPRRPENLSRRLELHVSWPATRSREPQLTSNSERNAPSPDKL